VFIGIFSLNILIIFTAGKIVSFGVAFLLSGTVAVLAVFMT